MTSDVRTIRIVYVTGNEGKFAEAKHVLANCATRAKVRILAHRVDADTTEIQGSTHAITAHKVTEACRHVLVSADVQKNAEVALEGAIDYVLAEDVSLELYALGGFPGPYCKPMLEAIAPEGLWNLMSKYADRRAEVRCTVGMIDMRKVEKVPTIFEGCIQGTVVEPAGDVKHGKSSWNSVFQPEGYTSTFGQLQYEEQAKISHRHKALEAFCTYILESMDSGNHT